MQAITAALSRELEDLETIRFVTSALFDVSAEKIGRLKDAFLRNGVFFEEIHTLYRALKQTAARRNQLSVVEGKSRRLLVPYTSNGRFYGSINSDTMRAFLLAEKKTPADVLVIGKTGKTFLESYPDIAARATYVAFAEDEPTAQETRALLTRIAAYDEVHVFYPGFVNVFTQHIIDRDITHTVGDAEEEALEDVDYIFEPELPKIMLFFETRIRYLLFERAVLETELSRTAARLFAMNRAQDRADEELRALERVARTQENTANDLRLLESFAALITLRS